jgi:hypothetical protein
MSLSSRDCPLVTATNVPLMARRSYPALALGCPWAASICFPAVDTMAASAATALYPPRRNVFLSARILRIF